MSEEIKRKAAEMGHEACFKDEDASWEETKTNLDIGGSMAETRGLDWRGSETRFRVWKVECEENGLIILVKASCGGMGGYMELASG